MPFQDTITALWKRLRPETTTTASDTPRPSRNPSNLASLFQARRERRSVIEVCRQMYDEDPRAKAIIQTVARDAVKGGFTVEADDPEAVEIADELTDRLNLKGRLDDWIRLTFRDGDSFLELGVTKDFNIGVITRKPTLQTNRFSNRFDGFDDPALAYWMSDQDWVVKPGPSSVWFAEWQIVHARWDHDEGSRYGRPLLSSARTAWKRVKEGELDIAVRRKTRAGMKYVHSIEGGQGELEAYEAKNREALDNPFAAVSDFIVNGKATIAAVQGDARLSDIADVEHHIDTFFLASPAPRALLGYGKNIDFSVIGHQQQQYAETLVEIQSWGADQFLRPIFERQWLMRGKLPETLGYEIKFTPKKEVSAADIEKISKAALQFQALGMKPEFIAHLITRFIPDIDPEMLLDSETGQVDAERLANIGAKLLIGMGNRG